MASGAFTDLCFPIYVLGAWAPTHGVDVGGSEVTLHIWGPAECPALGGHNAKLGQYDLYEKTEFSEPGDVGAMPGWGEA